MSSTILQRRSIPLIPLLAREIGTNEALVLQQINYWIERSKTSHDGRKWVYNTTKEWVEKEFCFMSESTLKRVLGNLKKLGLIESKQLSKRTGYHINYYTINRAAVANLDAKITAIEMQEIKDLEADSLDSISSELTSIGSEWPNDNSIGSEWPNHEQVNMELSRTVQNDPIISKSSHRVHSESSFNTCTEKQKPAKKKTVKQFVKPTLEQVRDYFIERGHQDAVNESEKWMDYYISNGWRVGKNPMKDWKAAIRNWMRNYKPQQTINQVNNYEGQSDYNNFTQSVQQQLMQQFEREDAQEANNDFSCRDVYPMEDQVWQQDES